MQILRSIVAELGGENRHGQEEMVRAVAHALENRGHLMVQAGTGTGKSFGYLVPTMLWCAQGGHRATISTATLALQRQIITHDAPAVAQAVKNETGVMPRIALLKGWNNYVCLRKAAGGYPEEGALLSRMEAECGDFTATAVGEEVARVRDWAMSTHTGDRDDLIPGVTDRVWGHISVSKPECMGESCPVRASCFAMQARLAADDADIVVTNHSMLGVATTGRPVLPAADAYIVDEAHALSDRVTSQLTASLSMYDISVVARLLRRTGLDDALLDDSAHELGEVLASVPQERLTVLAQDLKDTLVRLLGRAQEAFDNVEQMKPHDDEQAIMRRILRSRLSDIADICENLLSDSINGGSLVAWNESVGEDRFKLYVAPLDVSGSVARHIFVDTASILTSATLTAGGSFEITARTLGFTHPECGSWVDLDVGTPFSYHSQGILYVASHLPAPNKEGYGEEHMRELLELIEASGGGALGLFTSRAGVQRAAEYVREHSHVPVLCQGEDQLPTLIQEFSDVDEACLFGTMALWQGVDVPGRTLRLVIIDRIPFPRPNEPLTAARSEAVAARGGNPFMDVSASHASLLLSQGAGRLLRSVNDRGVVAILDSRLVSARYGSYLCASMPDMWRTTDPQVVRGALMRLNTDNGENIS